MNDAPAKAQASPRYVPCPVCSKTMLYYTIDAHVDKCLKANQQEKRKSNNIPPQINSESTTTTTSSRKKAKLVEKPTLKIKPLAEKLRPQTLKHVIGHEQLLGENKTLRMLLEADHIPSMILWGPPGCGKTTLALVIAQCSKSRFVTVSATSSGVADIRTIVQTAKNELKLLGKRTVLFIDEIHRFNKNQQDIFLPFVEDGTIQLIGATTENPSFEVNSALLSRCRVYSMQKLSIPAITKILKRAIEDEANGVKTYLPSAKYRLEVSPQAVHYLATQCSGDARIALNSLEMSVKSTVQQVLNTKAANDQEINVVKVTEQVVKEGFRRSHTLYDRAADQHYDCISALHKSIRGSDVNASLYWLGRMLAGGENPLYIARRLIRIASEDIGIADTQALTLAVSCFHGCHFIGMPECDVVLAHCVTYLAQCSKSVQVYRAWKEVKQSIASWEGPPPEIPLHLRNAPTPMMKSMGYGVGYKYNPDFDGPVDQTYLPKELEGITFFNS